MVGTVVSEELRAAPGKKCFGHMRTARPRPDCAFAQSDQNFCRPLTELLDTTECMTGKQRPIRYFARAQDALNLRMLRVPRYCFA